MRAILTYHSIDDSGSPISVSREAFSRHVTWLASGRVRVLPLRDLLASPERDAVAITFDDGFENFATEAWPLLRAHQLPATVFVVTQRVGSTNAGGDRPVEGLPTLPLMDWGTLDRLHGEGLDLGGHTRTHQSLTALGSADTADEVAGCAHDLHARYGEMPRAFAYPYGDAPALARRVARDEFACACTTTYRVLGPTETVDALPRLDMFYFQGNGAFRGWGSAAFRAQLTARRAARATRSALRAVRRRR